MVCLVFFVGLDDGCFFSMAYVPRGSDFLLVVPVEDFVSYERRFCDANGVSGAFQMVALAYHFFFFHKYGLLALSTV